jgi:hypothetical protein
MTTNTISFQDVVDVVMNLPEDRLVSVYDFARFVQSQPAAMTPVEDIFGETADGIRADQEQWEQQFAASREQLRAMAREAAAEFRAGETAPMTIAVLERQPRSAHVLLRPVNPPVLHVMRAAFNRLTTQSRPLQIYDRQLAP